MKLRTAFTLAALVAVIGAIAWGGLRLVRATSTSAALELPTTRVKQGRVTLTVNARGELQGGNSELLTAPMIGGGDMAITFLREPGELVSPGDIVAQLETTEQNFKLQEAEADLAEAQQQVLKAEADSLATAEESQYAVLSAESEVKLAELELRRNPTLAAITARQNEILAEAARNRLRQARQDLANKKTTASSGIAIQKAQEKAKTGGYVNIQQNTNQNMLYWGMIVLPYQIGDTTSGGMAVAQIPDLNSWEAGASIGELDRGHLEVGQQVALKVVALAGETFTGKVNLVITVATLDNVLWVPSQALFESDGRTFVYARGPSGFVPHDVTLVRRSESQAVVTGIRAGELVAMSNPDQQLKTGSPSGGAMKALSK